MHSRLHRFIATMLALSDERRAQVVERVRRLSLGTMLPSAAMFAMFRREEKVLGWVV